MHGILLNRLQTPIKFTYFALSISVMKIIENKHIDRERYQKLLDEYLCTEAAMQPWVLDAVSPGWGMLCDKAGNYLMPLPIRYKFLLPYTTMPIFGQRLDILSRNKNELVKPMLRYLKREFLRGNVNINLSPFKRKNVSVRQTYQLNLKSLYDQLWNSMSDGHQRNISKAIELNAVNLSPESWELLIEMKHSLLESKDVAITEYDRVAYAKLVKASVLEHQSPLYVAEYQQSVVAIALFVRIGNRFVIESATSAEGRKSMAAYAIINHFIQNHAGNDLVLDFAGSNIPSIAAFRKGFGATRSEYVNIQWKWI